MDKNIDRKKVWVVYHSRKGGHTYPSKALYDYIEHNARSSLTPALINLIDLSPLSSFIDKLGRYGDLKLKWLYKRGYQQLQKENRMMIGAYRCGEGIIFNASRVRDKLLWRYGRPDLIISLQPEVNVIAGMLKDWFSIPVHTVIIDLAVHGLWVNKHISHYYVANEPMKRELMNYSVKPGSISITGMPLRSGFSAIVDIDPKQIRNRLKISAGLPTILLMGGFLGTMVDFNAAISSIIENVSPFQLLIVFGRNTKEKTKAEALRRQSKFPVHIYGTVANMDEMMWASDIAVSKPGSVTMAETLSLGKPMVVITPRAGSAQELRFAKFLVDNGAGAWVDRADKVGGEISKILSQQDTYRRMSKNAWKLGHYSLHATKSIVEKIKTTLGIGPDK